jgi:hypothetical protein
MSTENLPLPCILHSKFAIYYVVTLVTLEYTMRANTRRHSFMINMNPPGAEQIPIVCRLP